MRRGIRQFVVLLLIASLAMLPLRMAYSSPSAHLSGAASGAMKMAHTTHCEQGGGTGMGCSDAGCAVCVAYALMPSLVPFVGEPPVIRLAVEATVADPVLHRTDPPFRPPRG